MLSINPTTATNPDPVEKPPKSSLPWHSVGFGFAFIFLFAEIYVEIMAIDEDSAQILFVAVMLGGWIYWLSCVHRYHKILEEMSDHRYPISPGEAVGKHFIPFYNFFWLFKWPTSLANYLNERGRVKIMPGALLGAIFLLAFFLRFVDGAIALACLFGLGAYISANLRKHISLVRGLTPDMLPPPPDSSLFGYTRPESHQ